jgi:S-adenosylmethionine-diacylgycerolhomoserine-N-methlytransferase
MRLRAQARVDRGGVGPRVRFDDRPYGTHAGYEGQVDRMLFSYSLSMIPPFAEVLEQAHRDLLLGGRIVVVDFQDALGPVAHGLERSHVHLGPERRVRLKQLFPRHRLEVVSLGFWRYFLFVGEVD